MKIAVDLDDVLIPFASTVLEYYNALNGTNHKLEEFDNYTWKKISDGTVEGETKLMYSVLDSLEYSKISSQKGAEEAIGKLHQYHDLYVVSARPTEMEDISKKTISRLFKDKFNKIILVNDCPISVGERKTKADVCSKLEAQVLIEDSERHAIGVASVGIQVLLYDKPWNQKVSHPNITRIYSWQDALREISSLSQNI
jgi:uncharacterized HAD superfamily protein